MRFHKKREPKRDTNPSQGKGKRIRKRKEQHGNNTRKTASQAINEGKHSDTRMAGEGGRASIVKEGKERDKDGPNVNGNANSKPKSAEDCNEDKSLGGQNNSPREKEGKKSGCS